MEKIYSNHDLYDTLLSLHPHLHESPIYSNRTKRLDYFLILSNIPTPRGICHNAYNLLYKSNHQSIFLDLPLTPKALLIFPCKLQEIHSTSNKVSSFIITMYNHLDHNDVFCHYIAFINTIGNDKYVVNRKKIDAHIVITIHLAKKARHSFPCPPWSKKLHHASLQVHFWSIAEYIKPSTKKNNLALQEIRQKIPTLPHILPDISTIKKIS